MARQKRSISENFPTASQITEMSDEEFKRWAKNLKRRTKRTTNWIATVKDQLAEARKKIES